MRKLIALAAIVFIAMAAMYVTACNSSTNESTATSKEDSLGQVIARGKYLANHVAVCIDCHSKRDFTKFSMPVISGTEGSGAGFAFGKSEGVPGEVTAPNITPFALGDWTDDEIVRAIVKGINKKGDTLFPMMPYHNYSRMAKEDVYAIVAYLRTLKSIDSTTPPRNILIPASMYGPMPQNDIAANSIPDTADKVKYGEYIVTVAACGECHTPRAANGAPLFEKAYSGGFVFNTPLFKVAVSNITPDSTTGIGAWTEDVFVQRFRFNGSAENVNRDPGRMNTMMPWEMYGKMEERDLRAIYAYLRSVPPVSNKVEKYPQ